MLPGEQFDESRLAKPEDFSMLDDDDFSMLELERQMDADLAALKAEVKQEKAKAKTGSAPKKPAPAAAEPAASSNHEPTQSKP